MYTAYYNFTCDPFRMRSRADQCFQHASYSKAQSYLLYSLHRGEGLFVVVGVPGSGKTTLVRESVKKYSESFGISFIEISFGTMDESDLTYLLAYELGLEGLSGSKAVIVTQLKEKLKELVDQGKRCVVVIDEAQSMTDAALDQIKALSNLEYKDEPLMQIFLVGQKILRERLQKPELLQVMQRVTAACEVEPMTCDETKIYIEHCLNDCDWSGNPTFSESVLSSVYTYSGGVPRLINLICSRLLLRGFVHSLKAIGTGDLKSVISDLENDGFVLPESVDSNSSEPVQDATKLTRIESIDHDKTMLAGKHVASAIPMQKKKLDRPDGDSE